jgi:hypothetical protein
MGIRRGVPHHTGKNELSPCGPVNKLSPKPQSIIAVIYDEEGFAMQSRPSFFQFVCAVLLCMSSNAMAAPSYQFAFDQSNYVAAPGDAVSIKVYLKETPGSGTPVLDADGLGMFGVGVALTAVPPLPVDPSFVQSIKDITPNGLFDDPLSLTRQLSSSPAITATLSEAVSDVFSPVHADNPEPGLSSYFLTIGTFLFTAG